MTNHPDPASLLFASFTPESTQGVTKGIHPRESCCLSVGCGRAGLGAGESTHWCAQAARAAAGEDASAGRVTTDDHGWDYM